VEKSSIAHGKWVVATTFPCLLGRIDNTRWDAGRVCVKTTLGQDHWFYPSELKEFSLYPPSRLEIGDRVRHIHDYRIVGTVSQFEHSRMTHSAFVVLDVMPEYSAYFPSFMWQRT
jgi:hypothetical protein